LVLDHPKKQSFQTLPGPLPGLTTHRFARGFPQPLAQSLGIGQPQDRLLYRRSVGWLD
jgi:hypothetical protein